MDIATPNALNSSSCDFQSIKIYLNLPMKMLPNINFLCNINIYIYIYIYIYITQQRDNYDTVIFRFLQIFYGLTMKRKV